MRRAFLFLFGSVLALPALAGSPEGRAVVDFSGEKNVGPGAGFAAYSASHGFSAELGTPEYFSIERGALHLVAAPGERSKSWNPVRLRGREDKVLLRLSRDGFREPVGGAAIEIEMAPLVLPGKGADVTDSDRNDACFYLLLGFDGPRHSFAGSPMPDTLAYVWADGAWKSGELGRDPEYAEFLRYVQLGRGSDRPGELRTIRRELAADFRKAFPERTGAVPDLVSIAVMVDSNTVGSRAESLFRRVRLVSAR